MSRPLRRAANVPLFRQSDYEVMPPTGDTTLPDAADPNAATIRSPPSLGLAATVRMTPPRRSTWAGATRFGGAEELLLTLAEAPGDAAIGAAAWGARGCALAPPSSRPHPGA